MSVVGSADSTGWAWAAEGLKYDVHAMPPVRCPPMRSWADLSMPVTSIGASVPLTERTAPVSPDRLYPAT